MISRLEFTDTNYGIDLYTYYYIKSNETKKKNNNNKLNIPITRGTL